MTRRVITILNCDRCGKSNKEVEGIREFSFKNVITDRIHFDLCPECMVECLDIFFNGYYVSCWENLEKKFNIKV